MIYSFWLVALEPQRPQGSTTLAHACCKFLDKLFNAFKAIEKIKTHPNVN
ncbi:hypothetical protein N478_01730 [Pseudoalteromonas luteoviolacea S4060-1]|uniref:Uncharacterized protein n=1 Tax=Pseudoalteromonas luteoviolacea S4060-1 TaxID=1365257 RepID=A0A161YX65_9GAMM|nr:hypothetical protein N478_01730 [Pseudoalteromonas luteoviolacea S4060-1]